MTALDEQLPRWHHRERHAVAFTGPAEPALAALEALTWREVPLFRALMGVRSVGRTSRVGRRRILTDFTAMGFAEVARADDEIVYAGIGRPWTPAGKSVPIDSPAMFRGYAEPGVAKMAINFRVVDGVLSTETRVWLTDPGSRRAFGLYWLLVRPFSGLIRRVWLKAAARRALIDSGPSVE